MAILSFLTKSTMSGGGILLAGPPNLLQQRCACPPSPCYFSHSLLSLPPLLFMNGLASVIPRGPLIQIGTSIRSQATLSITLFGTRLAIQETILVIVLRINGLVGAFLTVGVSSLASTFLLFERMLMSFCSSAAVNLETPRMAWSTTSIPRQPLLTDSLMWMRTILS